MKFPESLGWIHSLAPKCVKRNFTVFEIFFEKPNSTWRTNQRVAAALIEELGRIKSFLRHQLWLSQKLLTSPTLPFILSMSSSNVSSSQQEGDVCVQPADKLLSGLKKQRYE